jgi:lipopolysaccharide transport system ATP-binding protein
MKPAIRVEQLSKLYHIGALEKRRKGRTLREAVAELATDRWRRFRHALHPTACVERNGRPYLQGDASGQDVIWALKDVSFEVRPGQSMGIIGTNGSGKSTLLKILTGITEPTAGRAELRGRIGSLLEIGTGIHPDLSGRENIYLAGTISGLSRREITRKFDDIVAFAELEKFIDTPVKHYSSGMHMRLGFAVASHLEPHIMLVDEALAVGDLRFQKKCMDQLKRIHNSGMTILFISHSMDEVTDLCDSAVWLDKGVARALGRTSDVIQQYLKSLQIEETYTPSEEEAEALTEKAQLKLEIKEELRQEIVNQLQNGLLSTAQAEGFQSSNEPKKWGSREIEIVGARLLNAEGEDQRSFATGDAMIIELSYQAHQRIVRPVFGVALVPAKRPPEAVPLPCSGVGNSKWANQVLDLVEPGRGIVRCRILCLPCYAGEHYIDVATHSEAADVYYHYQERFCSFNVLSRPELDSEGYLYIPTQWEYSQREDQSRAKEKLRIP